MKLTKSKLKQIIKEEIGGSPSLYYAYITIPYEGCLILSGDTIEEVKEAAEEYKKYGTVQAIFTANIIEGNIEG